MLLEKVFIYFSSQVIYFFPIYYTHLILEPTPDVLWMKRVLPGMKQAEQSDREQGRLFVFYYYFGNFETSLIIYHTQIPDNQMTIVGGEGWGGVLFLFVILVWEEGVWRFLLFICLFGWFYYKFNSKINVVNAKTEGESICSFKVIWSRTFFYAKTGIIRKWIINKHTRGHKPGGQMINKVVRDKEVSERHRPDKIHMETRPKPCYS